MKKFLNTTLPRRLAIYVRVSTDKQARHGVSVDTQITNGIKKAHELGWEYEIYNDAGTSGSVSYFEREGIKRLMKDLSMKKLGGLYCFDIDRLSRDPDYVEPQAIITQFKEAEIKIFSNSGELDLTDSSIELMVRLKGVLASNERIQTSERVKSNLRNSMLQGKNAGGGQMVLFGYNRIDKKLVINEEEAKVVKLIFSYYMEGHGTKVITNLLNEAGVKTKRARVENGNMTIKKSVRNKETGTREVVKVKKAGEEFMWRDSVVYNMLKNTTYVGKKKYKDLIIETPRIIDDQTFDVVQALMKEKMRFKRAPYSNAGKSINTFLLKGVVRCGKCGSSFYGHKRADLKDKAYKCLSGRHKNGWCGNRGIDIDFLDNLVWKHLLCVEENTKTMLDIQSRKGFIKALQNEIISFGKQIAENTKHLLLLNRNYNEGKFEEKEYLELKRVYEQEIKEFQHNIDYAKQTNFLLANKGVLLDIIKDMSNSMNNAKSIEEKQGFVRAFIESVTIYTNNESKTQRVQIRYKFDQLSQFYVNDDVDINYKNNWHRIGAKSTAVKFWVQEEAKTGGKIWNSFEGLVDPTQSRAFNMRGAAVVKSEKNDTSKKLNDN